MFATIEEKLIVGAIIAFGVVVGILGYNHHERSEGATVCVQQQSNAASTEVKQDAIKNENASADFSGDLAAIPIAASHVPVLMCDASSSVRPITPTRQTQSVAPAIVKTDSGLQAGIESRVDVGPIVQDLALSGMLCSADATELWDLAVKESMP